MKSSVDQIATAVASGMPRRDLFRYLASAAMAGSALTLAGSRPTAQGIAGAVGQSTAHQGAKHKMRAITFKVGLPSGHTPLLHVPDRFPGMVWLHGQPKYTFIPQMIAGTKNVDVAIYRDDPKTPTLVGRMSLPVSRPKRSAEAATTPLGIPELQGWSLAALWDRDVEVPPTLTEENDCKVESCCYGGGASACAVCCNPDDENCGSCCDYGCCPPCS